MKNVTLLRKIVPFIIVLITITILKQFTVTYLAKYQSVPYAKLLLIKTSYNFILAIIAYLLIKTNNLLEPAGISNVKPKKIGLVFFGALYIIVLNILFLDDKLNLTMTNTVVLIVYCISIGMMEELSIRGYLQATFSKHLKNPIKGILIASLIFGLLHIIRFDKGLYGEVSQVFFATFIGIMFGALLVITKRLYPLIIAHALIDFFAKIDQVGLSYSVTTTEPTSLINALIITLLVSPCLFYGLFLIKKYIQKI